MLKNINVTVYFLCTWLFSIVLSSHYLNTADIASTRDQVHALLALLTYSLMYQAPAIISYWLLRRWRLFAVSVAILLAILVLIVIFVV